MKDSFRDRLIQYTGIAAGLAAFGTVIMFAALHPVILVPFAILWLALSVAMSAKMIKDQRAFDKEAKRFMREMEPDARMIRRKLRP
jgi:Flp pilus assembly protein TadB